MSEENKLEKLWASFKELLKTPLVSPDESSSKLPNLEADQESLKIPIDEEAIKSEIYGIISKESGWDRVKGYFSYDEALGRHSDFFLDNYEIVTSTGILGFLLGSILKTEETKHNFKNNSQLAIYTSKKAANRAFVDFVYLQMLKGGARISLRFMVFSGVIVTTASVIEAYRCKTNPLDFTVGGIVSGGLLRMHFGVYGLLGGSLVGGAFGTIFGAARYGQLKLAEKTYEDQRIVYLRNKIIQREILLAGILPVNKQESKNEQT